MRIIEYLLIDYIGAGIRFFYLRYIRREQVSFKSFREGKMINGVNIEGLKNSICGICSIIAIAFLAIMIKKWLF